MESANSFSEGILLERRVIRSSVFLLKIFTSEHGLATGVFRSTKSAGSNFLQPLALVEFSTQRSNSDLLVIKEINPLKVLHQIYPDYIKHCILLFLQELLTKTVVEQNPNAQLFHFLKGAIMLLDDCVRPANFPIWCTIEIIRHQGFMPDKQSLKEFYAYSGKSLLSTLSNSEFTCGNDCIELFLPLDWAQSESLQIPPNARRHSLTILLEYLRYHLELKNEFKSVEILHAVLQD